MKSDKLFHLELYGKNSVHSFICCGWRVTESLSIFQVKRKPGMEGKDLLSDSDSKSSGGIWDSLSR